MKLHCIAVSALIFIPIITGCSTMNSHFSCDVTASDSCLSIEEVDAMTSFADDREACTSCNGLIKAEHGFIRGSRRLTKVGNETLWVAKNIKGKTWA